MGERAWLYLLKMAIALQVPEINENSVETYFVIIV